MADQGPTSITLWSSGLRLSVLGPVRLASGAGEDVTPKSRKTRAVIAVLAMSRTSVQRSRLIGMLWGDRGEDQARASLRQALYELRELSAAGFLRVDREVVGQGQRRIDSDLDDALTCAAGGDTAKFAGICDTMATPLLGGIDGLGEEMDDWLRDERARMTALLVETGRGLAVRALGAGDPRSARDVLDRIERLDPLDEPSARWAIQAALASGDRAGAVRRLARLDDHLRNELGISAAPEIRALIDDLPEDALPSSLESADHNPRPSADDNPTFHARWDRKLTIMVLAVLLATVAALIALRAFWPAPAEARPTIAVLPFSQTGSGEDHVAEGLSDELLDLLSDQDQFRVLGRMSAQEVSGSGNALTTARDIGITHLLDGRVLTDGNRMVVFARLTRVSDGAQMWSERFDRPRGDVFELQANIARAVANKLAYSFELAGKRTPVPAVSDRYFAARQLIRERRAHTLMEAQRLLLEAIRLDPNFAPAFAELSQVTMLLADHPSSYGNIPVATARRDAAAYARRAIRLDPSLGDGYAALGFLTLSDGDSAPYYRKAVELTPQRSDFHRWLGQSLLDLNDYDGAIKEFRRAIEIDPLWGLNYDHLANALRLIGKDREARDIAARFYALSADDRAKDLVRFAQAKSEGRMAEAYRISRRLMQSHPDERLNSFNFATIAAALGERREAAAALGNDPLGHSILTLDWPRFTRLARENGNFFDVQHVWSAGDLMLSTGQSTMISDLFAASREQILASRSRSAKAASYSIVDALRRNGRAADAKALFVNWRRAIQRYPHMGQGKIERQHAEIEQRLLLGDRDGALRILEEIVDRRPFSINDVPAFSMRRNAIYASVAKDPRLVAADEKIRAAVNGERGKLGLAPISEREWVSDDQSLLTLN